MSSGLCFEFRETFPEFIDEDQYPEAVVIAWGQVARALLIPHRWRSLYRMGIFLYIAHQLVLQKQAVAGDPGRGVVAGKSVGDVSVNYDAALASYADAGHWNLTTYGKRFWQLQRMMGAGPIQVGAGGFSLDPVAFHNGGAGLLAINGPPFADEAWVGPQFWPGNGRET